MSELTNLTDRISHLRDREGGSAVVRGGGPHPKPPEGAGPSKRRLPERRLASDYFMYFVYALLAVALTTQGVLIVWLDLL